MDVIAGAFGFFPDLLPVETQGEISFEGIAAIQREFCPDASNHSALIGIVKALPTPCILLHIEPGLKTAEVRRQTQTGFNFADNPVPVLRAIYATVNEAAKEADISFFKNWRVPKDSVINAVFESGAYAEADEDLDWWEASGGNRLATMPIRVKAKKVGGAVRALLIPIAA